MQTPNRSTGEPRARVSLGADVGGKDAHEATHEHVLALRRLLRQKCQGPYGSAVREFALVLRIDGSVQAWGKRGAENAALKQKNAIATADIFVPISDWSGRDVTHIRDVLSSGVIDAVELLAKHAEHEKVDIAIGSLRCDVSAAVTDFLDLEKVRALLMR